MTLLARFLVVGLADGFPRIGGLDGWLGGGLPITLQRGLSPHKSPNYQKVIWVRLAPTWMRRGLCTRASGMPDRFSAPVETIHSQSLRSLSVFPPNNLRDYSFSLDSFFFLEFVVDFAHSE